MTTKQIQANHLLCTQIYDGPELNSKFIAYQFEFTINTPELIQQGGYQRTLGGTGDIYIYHFRKKQIAYIIMFQPFAPQQPYYHLEQYLHLQWPTQRATPSQNIGPTDNPLPKKSSQTSSLQFCPFQIYPQTIHQDRDSLANESQSSAFTSSLEEQMQQMSVLNPQRPFGHNQQQQKGSHEGSNEGMVGGKSHNSFNTADYIIKHCFKQMLRQEWRESVEPICKQEELRYPQFCLYWKKTLEKCLHKHIGFNRFKRMMDETNAKPVVVCRQFFTHYLWFDYPKYVAIGGMRNKQKYVRCATKLMYISCLSRTDQILSSQMMG